MFNPNLTKEQIAEIKLNLFEATVLARKQYQPSLWRNCIMKYLAMSEMKHLTVQVPPDEPHRPPLRRSPRLAKMARVDYSKFF